jgi:hypothetical protein
MLKVKSPGILWAAQSRCWCQGLARGRFGNCQSEISSLGGEFCWESLMDLIREVLPGFKEFDDSC